MIPLHLVHPTAAVRRGLVCDPQARHLKRMKQSVWLYLFVLLAAHRATGRRLLDPNVVAREMGISEATVRSWLGHLRRHGYVTVQREGSNLWVAVTRWRQDAPQAAPVAPRARAASRGKVRVSLTADAVAKRLGAPAEDPFLAKVITQASPAAVAAALGEVERVPASQIRKSRLALFRYLVQKHVQEKEAKS